MSASQFLPQLEILENREVPSATATLANGILTVNGTDKSDFIHVFVPQNNAAKVDVQVVINGHASLFTFDRAKVSALTINGGDGNDVIINCTNIPSTISGGNGNDRIFGGT
jgi:Ca2+-binding RTX toxin-like protein